MYHPHWLLLCFVCTLTSPLVHLHKQKLSIYLTLVYGSDFMSCCYRTEKLHEI